MDFSNIYFINGSAYAGKSTMVKLLGEKYNGIVCEENYHNCMINDLNSKQFPNLTYTRDIDDWSDFIRRTPDEYEHWIKGCNEECAVLELEILKELSKQNKKIFVDTNIPINVLKKIADKDKVLIMLAPPEISVNRFFERPDKEKQFLYQLLLKENNPHKAIENFKECLKRINSEDNYNSFLYSGYKVIIRDESRTVSETFSLVEKAFNLN